MKIDRSYTCFDCSYFRNVDPDVSWCDCHNYEAYPLMPVCPCFSLDTSIVSDNCIS